LICQPAVREDGAFALERFAKQLTIASVDVAIVLQSVELSERRSVVRDEAIEQLLQYVPQLEVGRGAPYCGGERVVCSDYGGHLRV
jgi:hypothetical protein